MAVVWQKSGTMDAASRPSRSNLYQPTTILTPTTTTGSQCLIMATTATHNHSYEHQQHHRSHANHNHHSGDPVKKELKKSLNAALALAAQAVKMDGEGDFASSMDAYERSIELLDKSIALMTQQGDLLQQGTGRDTATEIAQLQRIRDKYSARIAAHKSEMDRFVNLAGNLPTASAHETVHLSTFASSLPQPRTITTNSNSNPTKSPQSPTSPPPTPAPSGPLPPLPLPAHDATQVSPTMMSNGMTTTTTSTAGATRRGLVPLNMANGSLSPTDETPTSMKQRTLRNRATSPNLGPPRSPPPTVPLPPGPPSSSFNHNYYPSPGSLTRTDSALAELVIAAQLPPTPMTSPPLLESNMFPSPRTTPPSAIRPSLAKTHHHHSYHAPPPNKSIPPTPTSISNSNSTAHKQSRSTMLSATMLLGEIPAGSTSTSTSKQRLPLIRVNSSKRPRTAPAGSHANTMAMAQAQAVHQQQQQQQQQVQRSRALSNQQVYPMESISAIIAAGSSSSSSLSLSANGNTTPPVLPPSTATLSPNTGLSPRRLSTSRSTSALNQSSNPSSPSSLTISSPTTPIAMITLQPPPLSRRVGELSNGVNGVNGKGKRRQTVTLMSTGQQAELINPVDSERKRREWPGFMVTYSLRPVQRFDDVGVVTSPGAAGAVGAAVVSKVEKRPDERLRGAYWALRVLQKTFATQPLSPVSQSSLRGTKNGYKSLRSSTAKSFLAASAASASTSSTSSTTTAWSPPQGSFVTNRLFIQAHVWQNPGSWSSVPNLNEKVMVLRTVLDAMRELQEASQTWFGSGWSVPTTATATATPGSPPVASASSSSSVWDSSASLHPSGGARPVSPNGINGVNGINGNTGSNPKAAKEWLLALDKLVTSLAYLETTMGKKLGMSTTSSTLTSAANSISATPVAQPSTPQQQSYTATTTHSSHHYNHAIGLSSSPPLSSSFEKSSLSTSTSASGSGSGSGMTKRMMDWSSKFAKKAVNGLGGVGLGGLAVGIGGNGSAAVCAELGVEYVDLVKRICGHATGTLDVHVLALIQQSRKDCSSSQSQPQSQPPADNTNTDPHAPPIDQAVIRNLSTRYELFFQPKQLGQVKVLFQKVGNLFGAVVVPFVLRDLKCLVEWVVEKEMIGNGGGSGGGVGEADWMGL